MTTAFLEELSLHHTLCIQLHALNNARRIAGSHRCFTIAYEWPSPKKKKARIGVRFGASISSLPLHLIAAMAETDSWYRTCNPTLWLMPAPANRHDFSRSGLAEHALVGRTHAVACTTLTTKIQRQCARVLCHGNMYSQLLCFCFLMCSETVSMQQSPRKSQRSHSSSS